MEKKITSSPAKENHCSEIEKLALPIVEYLRNNFNPHTRVVITDDFIRMTQDDFGIPVTYKN